MVKLAVNGAAGRMGRQLLSAIALRATEYNDVSLGAAVELAGTQAVGSPASLLSAELSQYAASQPAHQLIVTDKVSEVGDNFDVIIDFTRPDSTIALLGEMQALEKGIVIGTTGMSNKQLELLKEASARIPVLFAPNFSAGVTLTFKLLHMAAQALGDEFDVEVIEAHHRNKVDAPSGTAVKMGEVLADALNRDLNQCAVYGREGITGKRDRSTIGFETIRGGDIIGDHTVLFAGLGERIEISHKATDRMVFANGAVRAACWLAGKPAGLYDMNDVLGLRE